MPILGFLSFNHCRPISFFFDLLQEYTGRATKNSTHLNGYKTVNLMPNKLKLSEHNVKSFLFTHIKSQMKSLNKMHLKKSKFYAFSHKKECRFRALTVTTPKMLR